MDESRPQGAIRVLVADDEPAMRSVLRDMLARVPPITVVGLAANADEAARLAAELRPDVALLDVRMPAGGGPAAALELAKSLPAGAWLSLNLSPETACSSRLLDLLSGAGDSTLVLEMTEHTPVHDYDSLTDALAILRSLGVRIAVDDAGAGFASLRHILMIEPDFIKLDISLTQGIGSDARRRALARALASFGDDIGGTVIAEGVETQDDLDALSELGVPCAQGFHLGRPMPRDAVRDLLVA